MDDEVIGGFDVRLYVHVDVEHERVRRAAVDATTAADPTQVAGPDEHGERAIALCDALEWPAWEIG
jgi:hypothetical protein